VIKRQCDGCGREAELLGFVEVPVGDYTVVCCSDCSPVVVADRVADMVQIAIRRALEGQRRKRALLKRLEAIEARQRSGGRRRA